MSKHLRGVLTVLVALAAGWLGSLLLIHFLTGEATPANPTPVATGDPYVDDLQHLSWLVRKEWSWLKLRQGEGLDLDALEEEAKELYREEPGERGFLRGLTRYVAGLSDGHGYVAMDGVDLQEERQWPFTLIEVQEGVMVDGISPAIFQSKALKRGDVIVEVNGKPIDEVLREQERFVFASTPPARRRAAIYDLTRWTREESLRIRALPMGATETVTVEVPCVLLTEPVPRPAWRRFESRYEEFDSKTAYYCVETFSANHPDWFTADQETRHAILSDQYDEYARVFGSVQSKDALILDLRGNGGGTDLLGQALALHLMEPGFRYLSLGYKRWGRWFQLGWQEPEVGRGTPRFRGKLVCLIDENCLSVTDNFATSLRDEHPNVVFVGQPTGGGSGAPRTFPLPETQARVTFCTQRVYAPNGTYVEGNGVQPDVLIRSSRAQMLAGEDAVLEAALAVLQD